jgi:nucleoside-diphosphate-sugar epimerase
MILVTGATGFIGSHLLVRFVAKGEDVVGVSRYPQREETRFLLGANGPVNLVEFGRKDSDDVDDLVGRLKPDTIVHLDANVNPPGLEKNPLKALNDNFLVSMEWLAASIKHGVSRFIFASSIGVLPRIQYEPIDAAHPIVLESEGPGSGFYGASKAAVEVFGLSFRKSYGLDFSSIRCSAVFGFGMQWPIGIKDVVERAVDGKSVTVPGFGPPRDYTPIDLVVDVFSSAATLDSEPMGIMYAATGRPLITVSELNKTFETIFPDAQITVTDENTDPGGIESLYRGVIDMSATRESLSLETATSSLSDSLLAYADSYREFQAWKRG